MERQEPALSEENNDKVFEFNVIPVIGSLIAAALIGWAVSSFAAFGHTEVLSGILAAVLCGVILVIRGLVKPSRLGTMMKADCWLFLVISIVASVALALWCPVPKYFFIIDGLVMVIFLSSIYKLSKTGV